MDFRERMVKHDPDRKLLDRTVALANEAGLFGRDPGGRAVRASPSSVLIVCPPRPPWHVPRATTSDTKDYPRGGRHSLQPTTHLDPLWRRDQVAPGLEAQPRLGPGRRGGQRGGRGLFEEGPDDLPSERRHGLVHARVGDGVGASARGALPAGLERYIRPCPSTEALVELGVAVGTARRQVSPD